MSSKDKDYQVKINKLLEDLEHIKDEKANIESRSKLISDYFDPSISKSELILKE